MTDILERLRGVQKLRGDTYSSYEVIGMIGQAVDEIERLTAALKEIVDSVETIARFPPGGYTPEGKLMLIAKRALEQSPREDKP